MSRMRLLAQATMISVGTSCAAMELVGRTQASDPITVLENTQGVTWSRGSARDLAVWFRGANDLVFLGRFDAWYRDTSQSYAGYRARCRIDSIITGYSPDSVVVFTRLMRPSFAAERLQKGTPVLARLTRRCTITGENCGDFMIVGNDGTLLSDHISDDQSAAKSRDPRPLRVQDIPLDVLCDGGVRTLFDGCAGVAYAALTEYRLLPSGATVWRCSQTTWVIRSNDSLPTYVRLPRKESCYVERPAGRYLIPVPSGFRGDTLFIDCCPRALRIKDGISGALGVTLPELREVVRRTENGRLHLVEPRWIRRGQEPVDRR